MRKQRLKRLICCLGAGCMLTASQAQQVNAQQERPFAAREFFIGASLGENWLFSSPTNSFNMVGKFSVGTNFNEWSGIRGVLNGGIKLTSKQETRRYLMPGVEYVFNFTRLFHKDYLQEQRFKVYLHAGAGLNFLYDGGSFTNQICPSGNIGVTGTYDIQSRLAFIVEWNNYLMQGRGYTSESWMPGIDLSIGLRIYPFGRKVENSQMEINKIRTQMQENIIRQEQMQESIEQMQKEIQETREFLKNKNLSISSDTLTFVDIYFNKYSSQLADRQNEKLARIAGWLKEHEDFSIRIIPFSDDRSHDSELTRQRGQEVINRLSNEFGIEKSRLHLTRPEEVGFRNVSDNSVKIEYIQNK